MALSVRSSRFHKMRVDTLHKDTLCVFHLAGSHSSSEKKMTLLALQHIHTGPQEYREKQLANINSFATAAVSP
ncbi:hypothetical protein NPIL_408691 [Nephila pilipes]|uniref:Uncharacterized protein n=1 Tax=Nephila pilipes TaxID=299642 RepID=A0A8X6N0F2_NEPPI|nr:hypothetical protein NPIL_408691 [Nephila pilipes]